MVEIRAGVVMAMVVAAAVKVAEAEAKGAIMGKATMQVAMPEN